MPDAPFRSLDDLLAKAGPQNAPPSTGASSPPFKSLDDLLAHANAPSDSLWARAGGALDHYFQTGVSAAGRVLSAFGQGYGQGWGSEPLGLSPDSEAWLKKTGIFNDYRSGQASLVRSFNEALIRPAATAIDVVNRAIQGAFRGAQGAAEQTALEAGAPPTLARDIAALPEALLPEAPHLPHALSPREIGAARDLGVIGKGEHGWDGTAAEEKPPPATGEPAEAHAAAIADATKSTAEEQPPAGTEPDKTISEEPNVGARETEPEPDIHTIARQIAPDTFREYDALAARKETFRRWLGDLAEVRRRDAEANAPHTAEIADLDRQIARERQRLEGTNPRRTKIYQARIDDLEKQRAPLAETREEAIAAATSRDTPDMQRVRQALMQTDYRMRDLAVDVSAAYREAATRMPQPWPEIAPSSPTAAAPTAEATAAAVQQPEPAIAPPAPPEAISGQTQAELPLEHPEPPMIVAPPEAQTAEPKPEGGKPALQEKKPLPPGGIASDVARQLVAAGRPQDEATAAGQLVAAYYETRAARFAGRLGTPEDLYARDAPRIVAGRGASKRAMEYAQGVPGPEPIPIGEGEARYVERGGERFVARADGSDTLGEITPDIAAAVGRDAAPIRLPEGNDAYGERHIEARHGTQIRTAGYRDAAELVADVANGFAEIYQARDGRLLLAKPNGRVRIAVVELRPSADGSHWTVTTAGLYRPSYFRNQELLWRRPGPGASPLEGGSPFNSPGSQSSAPLQRQPGPDVSSPSGESPFDPGSQSSNSNIGPEDELEQAQRGKIRLATKQARATITLLEHADASTFIHETGHAWLENLVADAAHPLAPQSLKDDAETVRKWLGTKPDGYITTRMHERFARGFEQYMREGRAPSQALARVFAQFRQWLTAIYQSARQLGRPITDDIRGVFDRMLSHEPGRTIIAREEEPPRTLADTHEAAAARTLPTHAAQVAEQVRAETEERTAPEVKDEIAARGIGAPGEGVGGGAPPGEPSDRHGPAPEPVAGTAGAREGAGELLPGGGEVAPQGHRASETAARRSPEITPYERVPRQPLRLVAWLKQQGGVRDEGGDVRAIIGGARGRIGLVNRNGLPLDEAALRAWEEGYLPEYAERPDIQSLLDAIEEDLKQRPRYSEHDRAAAAEYERALAQNEEIDRLAQERGVDPRGLSREQFFDAIADRVGLEAAETMAERLAIRHESALAEADRAAQHWAEEHGREWRPELEYGTPQSLEDIENADRRGAALGRPRAGAGGAGRSGPAAAGEAPIQEGARPGGGGAGARRGGATAEEPPPQPRAITDRAGTPDGPNDFFPDAKGTIGGRSEFVDKAGNIRLDLLGTPESVNEAIRDAADENDAFVAERRGVVSDAQVLALADALGMDAAKLNRRRIGEAFNAEQVVAARKLLIQSATAVRDAMARAAFGSEEDVLRYAEAKARHRMIQGQVAGITAEAGRALRAFRAFKGARDEPLEQFLETATGRTLFQMRREAQLGLELDTPAQVSKFVADSDKTGLFDWLQSFFVNALISGPATHGTYAVANALFSLWKGTAERGAAAIVGELRGLLGDAAADRVRFGEVPAGLYGFMRGYARDGWKAAWRAFKSNETQLLPGEEMAAKPFRTRVIPGIAGTVLESPGRLINAIHALSRTAGYTRSIAAQAYRTAAEEGRAGDDLAARIRALTVDPTEDMMRRAIAEAGEDAMMQKAPYGSLRQRFASLVDAGVALPDVPLPGGRTLPLGTLRPLRFVDPFVTITANIMDSALVERTPVGLLSPRIRDDLLGRNGGAAQDLAAGRMIAGSALMLLGGSLAAEGLLTGSPPSDPREASVKYLTGWQPYSVRIGDIYYQIHRLGVLGIGLGIAADLWDVAGYAAKGDLANTAAMAVHAVARNILDESFLRGPSELLGAIEEPTQHGESWAKGFFSSFVPFSVGLSQTARTLDPYMRQTRSVLDAIKAKIPFVSETLPPRYDIWGQPIPNRQALVPEVTALYESRINTDPANQALLRLGVFPAQLPRKIRGVALSDEQYDLFSRTAGRMAKMRVDAIVRMPGFAMLPAGVQHDMLTSAIRGARETARSLVMMRYPDIVRAALAAKRAQLLGPQAASGAAALH